MGYSLDATGKPTILATPTQTVADVQAAIDYAEKVGGLLKGTKSDRVALTSGQSKVGWLFTETDTGDVFVRMPSGWEPVARSNTNRFVRVAASDAAVSTGSYIGLAEGTIADARSGRYMVVSRASLYASGGAPVVGRVYAEWQTEGGSIQREEARWDLPNVGSYPTSPTIQAILTHAGGDLRVASGYRRDSGTFAVTGQGSGETVVTATYLGPI